MAAIPHVAIVSFLDDAETYMGTSPSVDFVTGISAILATTAKQTPACPASAFNELSETQGHTCLQGSGLPVETAALRDGTSHM